MYMHIRSTAFKIILELERISNYPPTISWKDSFAWLQTAFYGFIADFPFLFKKDFPKEYMNQNFLLKIRKKTRKEITCLPAYKFTPLKQLKPTARVDQLLE